MFIKSQKRPTMSIDATIFNNLLVLEKNIITFAVSLFRQNKN